MTHPPVSVVVVSRDRPEALLRCLTGLSQLCYPSFEVVVVADSGAVDLVRQSQHGPRIKLIAFDEANISAARNLGIGASAGEIVAFIDDDSVPEPTWLDHLCAPFSEDSEVTASGGFVRGRNGISFQWKANCVDRTGQARSLKIDDHRPTILHPTKGQAIKTEGTNMAVRRAVLAEMGGFDPVYRYFLDETDLNLRMGVAGHATAIVPLAEVHHGFHANSTRRASRAPTDLFEIGASHAAFLRKHCPEHMREKVRDEFVREQRNRALRFLQNGELEPRDVRRLLAGLYAGFEEGDKRLIEPLTKLPEPPEPFKPFATVSSGRPPLVLSGRSWRARSIREQARAQVTKGSNVSVYLFSPTTLFHKVRFHKDGFWEQTGGIFGRSERSQPLFRLTSFSRRLKSETARVARQRAFPPDV